MVLSSRLLKKFSFKSISSRSKLIEYVSIDFPTYKSGFLYLSGKCLFISSQKLSTVAFKGFCKFSIKLSIILSSFLNITPQPSIIL